MLFVSVPMAVVTAQSSSETIRLFAHGSVGIAVVEDSMFKHWDKDPDWDFAWTEIDLASDGANPIGMAGLDLDWRPGGSDGMVYLNAFADGGYARINRTADIQVVRLGSDQDPDGVTSSRADVSYDALIFTYGIGIGSTFFLLTSGDQGGGVRDIVGETSRVFRFGLMFGGAYTQLDVKSDSDVAERLLPADTHRFFYGFKLNFIPPQSRIGFDMDVRILNFRSDAWDKETFPLRSVGLVSLGAIVRLM